MTKSEKACRAILAAKKESQVVGAVREYLDSLEPADVAQLPGEILVLGLAPAEELIQSALQSLHSHVEKLDGKSKGGIVRETTLVFTAAARRLAALSKDTA